MLSFAQTHCLDNNHNTPEYSTKEQLHVAKLCQCLSFCSNFSFGNKLVLVLIRDIFLAKSTFNQMHHNAMYFEVTCLR